MGRDIKELNPLVQVMLTLALEDIRKQGVNPLVVETYRPQSRQNELYCKGRTVVECIAKGISKSIATKYCTPGESKITWTLNSVHKSRKAVDLVPQRNGDAVWNTKDPQTQIIIKTMQKYGFEAGANWSTTPDSPHFQVKGDFNKVFDAAHTTTYVTKAIQTALNKKINAGLIVDGAWGKKTTDAVNEFRKSKKYSLTGSLGTTALKALLK